MFRTPRALKSEGLGFTVKGWLNKIANISSASQVITSSLMRAYYILLLYITGGNAGLAAAYSAKELGIPITVVVPENTQDFMVVKIATEADFVNS